MIEEASDPSAVARARKKKESSNIPEFKDYWSRIIIDEIGYTWAEIPKDNLIRVNQPTEMRVFNPECEYLGRTKWPDNAWTVSHGHLLQVIQDEFGIDFIVYSIHPKSVDLIFP